ncbi:MAG: N-acetyl-alpha-D-glucosaminyl L-malate synthase BshA [Bacteroidota bacterium]|jgi:N-acetyl-alpha-D-glucosaminyl L-malate synthase BshA|nr:N-acetyl-alpha-D-glucosaminyl L-malate synthase BshA [Bacteroidota bacterium]MCF8200839.1 N-acetyl-alpha-D-glucosaminyl L-malate synthase BshA [Bacteroidia bacterium]
MRVGIVCYPTFGGSGVLATELGKALANKGHEVHFISYNQPARLDFFSENVFYHEVNIAKYPLFEYAPYETALAGKMVDIVQSAHLDVLHVHYAIPHASAALLAKQILAQKGIHIPVVTTLHGTDITLVGREVTYEHVVSWSINQSDAVTAVSNKLKEETLQHFDINRPIDVIPNFIDFNRFNKKPREHFKQMIAPNGEKIIIHTSNFRKVKRVEDVVAIFSRIIKEIPAKLLLIGDGPERSHIEKVCREHNTCDWVTFLGKQEAIEEILSIGDLFVLPSESESFGLAALEAMACEVPVISTNAGGIPEVNVHGVTGFLSNVGDVDSMAQHAITLLKDPEMLKTFRKNALLQAHNFDLKTILLQYEAVYERVVNPQ